MNTQSITPWLQDKSLWLTVLGLILPSLSAKLGVPLSSDKISDIIILIATFVIAHKAKSGLILWQELKLKALAAVTDDSLPAPTGPIPPVKVP